MNTYRRTINSWLARYRTRLSSYFYILLAFISVAGFAFFLASRAIFVDDSPILDSGVGITSAKTVGTSTVKIVQRKLNYASGYGEVLFEVNESSGTTIGQKYQAIIGEVIHDGKQEKVLPSRLLKVSEHYYVLQFFKNKPKWRHLRIDFGSLNKTQLVAGKDYLDLLESDDAPTDDHQSTSKTKKQQPFDLDYRRVKNNASTKPRSTQKYLADGLSFDLTENEKKLNLIKQDINKGHQQERAMRQKINALKADEAYQTDADVLTTEVKIKAIKSNIKDTQDTLKKAKDALSDLYHQQDNLRAKLRHLSEK